MEGLKLPENHNPDHDPAPEEEDAGFINSWTHAVFGQSPNQRPATGNTIRYLVAEQAGFRNAWALGIAPPPSMEATTQRATEGTPALLFQPNISPETPQSFASLSSQNILSHLPRTGNLAPSRSAIQRTQLATVKPERKPEGMKNRLLYAKSETDSINDATGSSNDDIAGGRNAPANTGGSTVSSVSEGAILEEAPPPSVDIQLLGNLEITVEEYLTFFPLHTLCYKGLNRLVQNGWNHENIARFINWARNLQPTIGRGRLSTTIETQIARSDERIYGGKRFGRAARRPEGRVDDLTTTQWTLSGRNKVHDYPLRDIIKGVVHFPTGEGRREITMAMEYAKEHPYEFSSTEPGRRLMVSDIPLLIEKHGFSRHVSQIRIGTDPEDHPDFRALANHRDAINQHDKLAKLQVAPERSLAPRSSRKKARDERDLRLE